MKFYRSLIKETTPLPFKETFDFSGHDYSKDYPLLEIVSASGEGEVYRHKKGIAVYLKAKAKVALSDARSCKRIERTLAFEDEFDLVENPEDEEAEGYIFPENEIDLTDVYYCALKTHLPYNASDEAEPFLEGQDYIVYLDDEPNAASPFDVLKDFDTDN